MNICSNVAGQDLKLPVRLSVSGEGQNIEIKIKSRHFGDIPETAKPTRLVVTLCDACPQKDCRRCNISPNAILDITPINYSADLIISNNNINVILDILNENGESISTSIFNIQDLNQSKNKKIELFYNQNSNPFNSKIK